MTHCLGSFWRVMRPLWASVTPEIPMPAKTARTRIHPRLRFIHPPILHLQRVQLNYGVSLFLNWYESKSLGGGAEYGGPHHRPSWPGVVDATSREISRSFL